MDIRNFQKSVSFPPDFNPYCHIGRSFGYVQTIAFTKDGRFHGNIVVDGHTIAFNTSSVAKQPLCLGPIVVQPSFPTKRPDEFEIETSKQTQVAAQIAASFLLGDEQTQTQNEQTEQTEHDARKHRSSDDTHLDKHDSVFVLVSQNRIESFWFGRKINALHIVRKHIYLYKTFTQQEVRNMEEGGFEVYLFACLLSRNLEVFIDYCIELGKKRNVPDDSNSISVEPVDFVILTSLFCESRSLLDDVLASLIQVENQTHAKLPKHFEQIVSSFFFTPTSSTPSSTSSSSTTPTSNRNHRYMCDCIESFTQQKRKTQRKQHGVLNDIYQNLKIE